MKSKLCPYCSRETVTKKQRHDYAGNPAGVMCNECWETSALNPYPPGPIMIRYDIYSIWDEDTEALVGQIRLPKNFTWQDLPREIEIYGYKYKLDLS